MMRPKVEIRLHNRTGRVNEDVKQVRSERVQEQALVYAHQINSLFQERRKSFILDAQYARTIKTVAIADIVNPETKSS